MRPLSRVLAVPRRNLLASATPLRRCARWAPWVAPAFAASVWGARELHCSPVVDSSHALDPSLQARGRAKDPSDSHPPRVWKVVLTGGPCGGKSSSLNEISKTLSADGFDVYSVPETPTLLMNGGCHYPGLESGSKLITFETALVRAQMQMEDSFVMVARSTGRPSVIVLDRGVLDPSAYLPRESWETILSANGWTESGLAGRYDLVLHLVTAADGAEKFYTTTNNAARKETPEQARALDKKMIACWAMHPRHRVVSNRGGFDLKLSDSVAHVSELLRDVPDPVTPA